MEKLRTLQKLSIDTRVKIEKLEAIEKDITNEELPQWMAMLQNAKTQLREIDDELSAMGKAAEMNRIEDSIIAKINKLK